MVSDEQTLQTMNSEFVGGGGGGGGGYLMCPHTAVAMAAVAVPGLLHCGAAAAPPLPPGRGLHSFPSPLNFSLPVPLNFSLPCPLHNPN